MSIDWRDDHQWARRFIPEMKGIVAQVLIGEAPEVEDAQHNTDLIILRVDETRVACRVRRYDQYERYCQEFTIRASRPSGTTTELEKLIAGWGRYLLYAFADPTETRLYAWLLGDLNVFRVWYSQFISAHAGIAPGQLKGNKDGSSQFRSFGIADLPPGFAVRRHAPDPLPHVLPAPVPQHTTVSHTELAYELQRRRLTKVAAQQLLGRWLPKVPLRERTINLLTETQARAALAGLNQAAPADTAWRAQVDKAGTYDAR